MSIEGRRAEKLADLQIWCGKDLVVNLQCISESPTIELVKKLWDETLDYFEELSDSLFDNRTYKVCLIYAGTSERKEQEIFVPLRNNAPDDSLVSTESERREEGFREDP